MPAGAGPGTAAEVLEWLNATGARRFVALNAPLTSEAITAAARRRPATASDRPRDWRVTDSGWASREEREW